MELPKPVKLIKAPKPIRRTSRPRRRRKGKKATLAQEADRLWSLIVRRRGQCEVCSAKDGLQGAHGISRRYRATRWLPINGFCLCRKCHVYFTHRPLEWDDVLEIQWGALARDELRRMALEGTKPDLEAVVEGLKLELCKLVEGANKWQPKDQTRDPSSAST